MRGKRAAVSVLVVALIAALGTTATGAVTASTIVTPAFSDVSGNDAEFELSALAGLGVFSGDRGLGGTVRPGDPINRGEYCKVVVTAMGKAAIAAGLSGLAPNFVDAASIPEWAWGYVNAAQMMGVIGGYLDGTFQALRPVNYSEAVTMLVRAVGGHDAQVPAGIWPYSYLWYALDNGFTGDVELSFPNLPCTRGGMAGMVFATMQVNQLKADGDERADSSVLHGRVFKGPLLDYQVGVTANVVGIDFGGNGVIETGEKLPLAPTVCLAQSPNLESLRNLPVMAITGTGATAGKVVFIGPTEGESGVYTGLFDQDSWVPAGDKTGYRYLRFIDGTVIPYDYPDHITAKINGCLVHDPDAATPVPYNETDLELNDLVTVTKDADGFAVHCDALRDYLFEEEFGEGTADDAADARAWVTSIKPAATSTKDTLLNVTFRGNPDHPSNGNPAATVAIPEEATVTINGSGADRNDLAKWDLITIGYYNNDDNKGLIYVKAIRKAVDGKVTAKRTETDASGVTTYCTIGGHEYEYQLLISPVVSQVVRFGLDRDGVCYVPFSYGSATHCWWIKSYVDNTGPNSVDTLTVDILGTETSMAAFDDGSFSSCCGYVGCVDIADGGEHAGMVTDIQPYWYLDEGFAVGDTHELEVYEVLSVDSASGIVVMDMGGEYEVLNDPDLVVYALAVKWNGLDWVYYTKDDRPAARIDDYIGFEGLHAGDLVFVSTDWKVLLLHDERVDLEANSEL